MRGDAQMPSQPEENEYSIALLYAMILTHMLNHTLWILILFIFCLKKIILKSLISCLNEIIA